MEVVRPVGGAFGATPIRQLGCVKRGRFGQIVMPSPRSSGPRPPWGGTQEQYERNPVASEVHLREARV
jgi:hypothetical protein